MANRLTKAWEALIGRPAIQETKSSREYGPGSHEFAELVSGASNASYHETVKKLYEGNEVGYQCVSLIASAVGALEWYVQVNGKEVEGHPLQKLIDRPNPAQGRGSFFTCAQGSKLLDGNTFIEMVGPSADGVSRKAPPRELWTLRPDFVEVRQSSSRIPTSYVYSPSNANAKTYPVNPITGQSQIIHVAAYSPLADTEMGRGLAPAKAAWLSLLSHVEGQRWNLAMLKNGARPSIAFLENPPKEGMPSLTQEQVDDIRKQINLIYGGGAQNAGRPMVVTGGFTVSELSLNPKDMDWANGRNASAASIALAFRVPSQLIGIDGSLTFANYEQARLAFYEDTVLPHAYALRDELNRSLSPLFGDGVELCIDEDAISALEAKRETKWTRANASSFLTVNEKRAMVGYDDIGPVGDEILVPTSVLPLGASIDDGEDESEAA